MNHTQLHLLPPDLPTLGASPSRSAVSLSPTKDGTALALSPSAKDSASAVLQESNHTSELQYSSLLSEKPKVLQISFLGEMGLDPNESAIPKLSLLLN